MEKMTLEELVVILQRQYCEEMFDHITKRFMPLIKSYARQIYVPNFEMEDYYQEGRIMMLEAIKTYDTAKQRVFSGFYKLLYKNQLINLSRAEAATKRGGGVMELPLDYHSNKTHDDFNFLNIIENKYHISAYDSLELKEKRSLYLDSLSALEFDVFTCFLNGLNLIEVATALNISKRQVQSAFDRCRLKLKAIIFIDE